VTDGIIGIHAIKEALNNTSRSMIKLYNASEKRLHSEEEKVSKEKLQSVYQQFCEQNGFKIQKIQGDAFLLTSRTLLPFHSFSFEKMLLLDGVTDVHNIAAIIRTAAFFNFDACFIEKKKEEFSPDFFRLASGGFEHTKVFCIPDSISFLKKLKNYSLYAMDEKGSEQVTFSYPLCLIIGSEDRGISFALKRQSHLVKIPAKGSFTTLNASVAAALAMSLV
jgi:23S rRNA (guanosine2251-2'-O)-methyltransferase